MVLPVTAVFAGLLALWLMFLQSRVIAFRAARRVALGHGGHEEGLRLIRAHGNAAETVPIFLILLALGEGMGAPGWIVALLGTAFLAGRVLHGLQFVWNRPGFTWRMWGMILTLAATGLAALGAIGHGLAEL
jgi:uncharacterized membrane protein YecN with MAPEG domain